VPSLLQYAQISSCVTHDEQLPFQLLQGHDVESGVPHCDDWLVVTQVTLSAQ